MARKRIPDKIRQKVIRDYEAGKPKTRIADAYGISTTSVTRIVKEGGSNSTEPGPGVKAVPSKEAPSPEGQKKLSEVERRINELEKKILYYDSKKKGLGSRA
ncbi:MAG: helix-turn-helix domain-containing protein [Thermodesulfobacteriota bacterium]